jgi:hypothetical protein
MAATHTSPPIAMCPGSRTWIIASAHNRQPDIIRFIDPGHSA